MHDPRREGRQGYGASNRSVRSPRGSCQGTVVGRHRGAIDRGCAFRTRCVAARFGSRPSASGSWDSCRRASDQPLHRHEAVAAKRAGIARSAFCAAVRGTTGHRSSAPRSARARRRQPPHQLRVSCGPDARPVNPSLFTSGFRGPRPPNGFQGRIPWSFFRRPFRVRRWAV